MLFSITLHYLRPADEIQAQLNAHKAWLVDNIRQGRILCTGPMASGTGGFILAHGDGTADMQQMIATDPFALQQLARFEIQAFKPVLRAERFPEEWASQANAV